MPTKRFDKKHWKMVVVLLAICGAMLWRCCSNQGTIPQFGDLIS
ncbi:small membrane protein YniD [Escherichia coli]|nr:small membrane protein YniD [Escherichia coli]